MANALLIGLGALIVYLVACYWLARRYVRPGTPNKSSLPKGFRAVGANWVSDRLSEPVFILVHGYGGSQSGWLNVAQELQNRGFGVVIPAMPGHGERKGELSGFSVKESQIVVDVVDWVHSEVGGKPRIVLVGISMGGAACWLATEKNPKIEAVVSEGSFARLGDATKRWMNRRAPGAYIALFPVTLLAKRMTGVDPNQVNPVESASRWQGKSLVIHGDRDKLFSLDDARALAEAAGGDLWIVEGASHAHCSTIDLQAYVDRISALVLPGSQDSAGSP